MATHPPSIATPVESEMKCDGRGRGERKKGQVPRDRRLGSKGKTKGGKENWKNEKHWWEVEWTGSEKMERQEEQEGKKMSGRSCETWTIINWLHGPGRFCLFAVCCSVLPPTPPAPLCLGHQTGWRTPAVTTNQVPLYSLSRPIRAPRECGWL